jgi:hypothetical protein
MTLGSSSTEIPHRFDAARRRKPRSWPNGTEKSRSITSGPQKKTVSPRDVFPQLTIYPFDSCGTDPLVHHGRHFGRVVHALCTVNTLLNNGILRMGELADRAEDTFTREYVIWSVPIFGVDSPPLTRERREHQVFRILLQMIPGMEDRLMEGSEEDIVHIAELVCNSGAPLCTFSN